MWYIEYFWVKLNILVLTPLVWIENKYKEYQRVRLEAYVKYQIAMDNKMKK